MKHRSRSSFYDNASFKKKKPLSQLHQIPNEMSVLKELQKLESIFELVWR